jgi:hypothetical protein
MYELTYTYMATVRNFVVIPDNSNFITLCTEVEKFCYYYY